MRKITFKSTTNYFRKESLGLKQNTVREFDDKNDPRKLLLDQWLMGEITNIQIEIINVDDEAGEEHIIHKISDVTVWKNKLYIISWNRGY